MSKTLFDKDGFGVGYYAGPNGTPMADVTGYDAIGQLRCIQVSRFTFDAMIATVATEQELGEQPGDWRRWVEESLDRATDDRYSFADWLARERHR
jgi:hypothetical protein